MFSLLYIKFNNIIYLTLNLCALLIISSTSIQCQNIKVQYLRKRSNLPKAIIKIFPQEKIQKWTRSHKVTDWYYSLSICSEHSYWTLDSVVHPCPIRIQDNDRPYDILQTNSSDSNIIYMRFHFDTSKQYYLVLSEPDSVPFYLKKEWIIDFTSSKEILGYKCFKATSKKSPEEVLWFTPEIPTRYGPRFLNGLPGLVLESTDIISHYKAIKIVLHPLSNCHKINEFNHKVISIDERNSLFLNHYEWSINAHDPCSSKKK